MATICVEKSYSAPGRFETIGGIMKIDVYEFIEGMKNRSIQTSDPRIVWSREPMEGLEYEDFSFKVAPLPAGTKFDGHEIAEVLDCDETDPEMPFRYLLTDGQEVWLELGREVTLPIPEWNEPEETTFGARTDR